MSVPHFITRPKIGDGMSRYVCSCSWRSDTKWSRFVPAPSGLAAELGELARGKSAGELLFPGRNLERLREHLQARIGPELTLRPFRCFERGAR